jgi:lambda repressor-like predicted transcriptional regulator
MSEQLDSLRQAATTLLTVAPAGAVLIAVRALLDGLELEQPPGQPATAPATAAGRLRATLAAKVQTTAHEQKADELAEWERLRQQVRAVRQARGITLRALAGELGLAASTVESALQTRRPPSQRLQQHLMDWLAAPVVAATSTEPFRPNGPGHVTAAGDGADQPAAR